MYLDPSSSRRHLISANQVHSKPNLIERTCPIQDPDYGVFASHSSAELIRMEISTVLARADPDLRVARELLVLRHHFFIPAFGLVRWEG